ncbi:MAG TPA: hypothetical protein VG672_27200 [Bryobacteraceae bacterium]|nr:hypothetical protein [Bryobacteraceae bacterium]
MPELATLQLDKIGALLAERGYEISNPEPHILTIREVGSGIAMEAVLEENILFLSLPCATVAPSAITPEVMRTMLAADNGISTSHFQLYDTRDGKVLVSLNNFCKLQELGNDDEDDILSCVHFLLVDVIEARTLLGSALA